ncbi:MAG: flagellar export chaperone FlgN [Sulfitobacter sp.]
MTQNKTNKTVSELADLLDAEREALLAGDLEKLNDLLVPKEALIDAMGDLHKPDAETLDALGTKVERNQLLLDGALEGIRAVATRMAKLREVKGTLETYGADGKKRDIPLQAESSVEHRV